MNLEKTRVLTDIEIEEVSLVSTPANRRKFLFFKEDKKVKELIELLKSFMPDGELDYDLIEKAVMKSDVLNSMKSMMTTMNEYTDMPDELKQACIKLIKSMMKQVSSIPEMKKSDMTIDEHIEEIGKAGKALSRATTAKLKAIREEINSLIPEDEPEEDKEDMKKEDIDKILDGVKAELIKSNESITGEITKLNERIIELEKGDTKSKALKQDKAKVEKKVLTLEESIAKQMFGIEDVEEEEIEETETKEETTE